MPRDRLPVLVAALEIVSWEPEKVQFPPPGEPKRIEPMEVAPSTFTECVPERLKFAMPVGTPALQLPAVFQLSDTAPDQFAFCAKREGVAKRRLRRARFRGFFIR